MGTCCAALCASPPAHRSWEQVQSASSRTASTASYAMMRHSPHAPHMILRALASGPSLQSQPSRKNRATDRLVPFDMNARGVLHKNACMTTPHAGARALACMAGASKHAAVADTDATCRRSIGARRASKRMRGRSQTRRVSWRLHARARAPPAGPMNTTAAVLWLLWLRLNPTLSWRLPA